MIPRGELMIALKIFNSLFIYLEYITGDTPDITEHSDFGFYNWVTFKQNAGLGLLEIG